ncbi:hypothetical protein DRQ36_03865 [bacterium]|nr:MAG: hypothetical protein DRQ36_03865 [bacterium]
MAEFKEPFLPPDGGTGSWESEYFSVPLESETESHIKTPALVQAFLFLAVVIVVAFFFTAQMITEGRVGWFMLFTAFALMILVSFGVYAINRINRQAVHFKQLLNIDRTTGLYSSVFMMEELDRLVAQPKGNLVLIFLDLDELKTYNDKYGHRAGDKLIRDSAEALMDAIVGRGVGFRYGGDEFVAVLNDVSIDEALSMAKRVHRAFENREISASIGVYPWRPGLSADEFLHEADKAMYIAKRSGKGRVFFGGAEIGGTMDALQNQLID